MKVSRLLAVALFTSACGTTTPAAEQPATPPPAATMQQPIAGEVATAGPVVRVDPAIPADPAVLADFQARVDKYAELHKKLAKGSAALKETSDPVKINAAKDALASKILVARADAKHGDIFTSDIRIQLRRLLAPELKSEDGRDAKAIIKDDAPAPGSIPFKVNGKWPDSQPLPSVPANMLQKLPTLPEPLEYRIVGQHLLLLDTSSGIIADYILNVIVT